MYKSFFKNAIQYDPNIDDKAGEEFYYHNARKIIGHWLQGKNNAPEEKLYWATSEISFIDQVKWFLEKCEMGLAGWEKFLKECYQLSTQLAKADQQRFFDQLNIQVLLHVSGCKGFLSLCKAYLNFSENDHSHAFVQASQSIWYYKDGLAAFKRAEHGKWENFYRADWLTNIKSTIYSLEALRKFLRIQGDSPDFFLWYKEYLMPETEKHIYLENTHRNPLSDDELAKRLAEKFNL